MCFYMWLYLYTKITTPIFSQVGFWFMYWILGAGFVQLLLIWISLGDFWFLVCLWLVSYDCDWYFSMEAFSGFWNTSKSLYFFNPSLHVFSSKLFWTFFWICWFINDLCSMRLVIGYLKAATCWGCLISLVCNCL